MEYKDKNGIVIEIGDTVRLGEKGHTEDCQVVNYKGKLCLRVSWTENYPPLKAYCNKTFRNCIEVVDKFKLS